MSKAPRAQSISSVAAELSGLRKQCRETLGAFIANADTQDSAVFAFVVKEMLAAGFEQKDLAEVLQVSRASISRWSNNSKLPPQAFYRETLIAKLRSLLEEALAQRPQRSAGRDRTGHQHTRHS